MILDANKGIGAPFNWHVWHCERCCQIKHVSWIDDQTNTYGTFETPTSPVIANQAKAIRIIESSRLVLINPVPDPYTDHIPMLEWKSVLEPQ